MCVCLWVSYHLTRVAYSICCLSPMLIFQWTNTNCVLVCSGRCWASVRPLSVGAGWSDNLKGPSTKDANGHQHGGVMTDIIRTKNIASCDICVWMLSDVTASCSLTVSCCISWATTPLSLSHATSSLIVYMCINVLFLMWYTWYIIDFFVVYYIVSKNCNLLLRTCLCEREACLQHWIVQKWWECVDTVPCTV